jgi:hypothetical protein
MDQKKLNVVISGCFTVRTEAPPGGVGFWKEIIRN